MKNTQELPHSCQLASCGPGQVKVTNEQREKVHATEKFSIKQFNAEKKQLR